MSLIRTPCSAKAEALAAKAADSAATRNRALVFMWRDQGVGSFKEVNRTSAKVYASLPPNVTGGLADRLGSNIMRNYCNSADSASS